MSRTRFEAGIAKRANVNRCEANGLVADSMQVRLALINRMNAGEITLEQVQSELKRIKRAAKKSGLITRQQAFSRG